MFIDDKLLRDHVFVKELMMPTCWSLCNLPRPLLQVIQHWIFFFLNSQRCLRSSCPVLECLVKYGPDLHLKTNSVHWSYSGKKGKVAMRWMPPHSLCSLVWVLTCLAVWTVYLEMLIAPVHGANESVIEA